MTDSAPGQSDQISDPYFEILCLCSVVSLDPVLHGGEVHQYFPEVSVAAALSQKLEPEPGLCPRFLKHSSPWSLVTLASVQDSWLWLAEETPGGHSWTRGDPTWTV